MLQLPLLNSYSVVQFMFLHYHSQRCVRVAVVLLLFTTNYPTSSISAAINLVTSQSSDRPDVDKFQSGIIWLHIALYVACI